MNKSNKNAIQQFMEENYLSMSEKTKENLFGVSNAVFTKKVLKSC